MGLLELYLPYEIWTVYIPVADPEISKRGEPAPKGGVHPPK
jgi:hypothetical protein